MSVIVEGEDSTQNTLLRGEASPTGIIFEVFHEEKGMVKTILSEEKWISLENYIDTRREELHEMKEKSKKIKPEKGCNNGKGS